MNNINLNILFRNILIHNEIEKISTISDKYGIKLVLLKGAALIELFPEYSFIRELEDIDVMIEKKDFKMFVNILKDFGYVLSEDDPNVMSNENLNIKIDITTDLWYMTKKEKVKLFGSLLKLKNFYVLPPKEMLKHILIHSYINHNFLDEKWQKDIKLLIEKFSLNVEDVFKIPKIIFMFLRKEIFYKGHFLPLFLLPFNRKAEFLFNKLFPSADFIIRRYNIKKRFLIPFFYIYRIIDILTSSYKIIINLLTFHVNKLSLNSN